MKKRRSPFCKLLGAPVYASDHAIDRAIELFGLSDPDCRDRSKEVGRGTAAIYKMVSEARLAKGEGGKISFASDEQPSLVVGGWILHLVRNHSGKAFIVRTLYELG